MTNAFPPIFQSIFGDSWDNLPSVMHKHYANRPYSNDHVMVEGVMHVKMSKMAKICAPILRWSGALVPHAGYDIPVTVHFRSEENSTAFCFDRIFHFPQQSPYRFRSRMVPIGGNEVVEFMPIGIGWRAAFQYDGQRVTLTHRGYAIRFRRRIVSLPLTWLLGAGEAWEEAIDENRFHMRMVIRHWLFGEVYAYGGEFTLKDVAYA